MQTTLLSKIRNRIRNSVNAARHDRVDTFRFIHINKSGGSSIEKALHLPIRHRTVLQYKEELGAIRWDKLFKFSVVRNPWDKVVSHYHYRVATNQTGMGVNPMSFADWVRAAYRDRNPAFYDKPMMFMAQTEWLVDETGSIDVDYVARFENLSADFRRACELLHRPVVELPHEKKSVRRDFRFYYDSETMQIVADVFRKDLENFHYSF